MAKRRGRRDLTNPIANDPLSVLIAPVRSPLTLYEDRRTYHPEGPDRPFVSVQGIVNTITTETVNDGQKVTSRRSSRLAKSSRSQLVFGSDGVRAQERGNDPAVCVRRNQRREVIFAKGKGGSKHKRIVRRTPASRFGC